MTDRPRKMPTWGGQLRSRREVLVGLSSLALLAAAGCGGSKDAEVVPASSTITPTQPPQPGPSATPSGSADATYFPPPAGEWESADPTSNGWSPAGLEKLVKLVGDSRSSSFMMLVGGRVLTENYFAPANTATHSDVASVQKSFTSTLIGIAREKGLLKLDDPVSSYLAPGWSQASAADEAKITLRQLMTHSSGLDPRTLKKVAEPGTKFDYNTDAYQRLRLVLEKATGMDINRLTRVYLFDPIAVSSEAKWVERAMKDATGVVLWGLDLAARDMARFGLLALRGGRWAGSQPVPAGWFDEAWTSSATKVDYGLLWWLTGKGPLVAQGAPTDMVSALGARDQKIYVVPGLDLVVTRQGLAAKEVSEAGSTFDAVLIKAIKAARA